MGSWVRGGAPSTSTGAGWGAEGGASPQTTWEWSRSRKEAPSGHALGVKGAHYLSFRRSDLASKGLLDPREPTTLQNGQRPAMVSELAKKEGGQLGRLPKYEAALSLTYSLASQLGPDPYRLSSKGQPWLQNSRRLMFSQSRRPLTQSINRDCRRIVPYKANKQEWVHKNNRHVFRKPRYEIPDHLRPSFPWS